MRLVVALGGNALLERGESPLAEIQEKHVQVAVDALAPLARDHDLVITHGNGPQVGLLALESATDPALPAPLSFRRARRPDPGDDRLLPPPGPRERPARAQVVASLICQTWSSLTIPRSSIRPSSSVRSTLRRKAIDSRVGGDGGSGGMATSGDGWWRRLSPWSWSRCRPSGCCWATARSSSAPVAAEYPYAGGQTGCCGASKPWWTRT